MSKHTKGVLSIMVPVLVWGISFVNTEYLLQGLGAMTIGAVRFIAATLMLRVMLKHKNISTKIEASDRLYFIVAGFVGIALYFYFENTGIKYISAGPSSLIMSAIPVLSLVMEALVYKRKTDVFDLFVVFFSIVGVAFIIGVDLEHLKASGQALGYWMMLGAAVTWVIYSLVSKPLFAKYDYLLIVYYQFYYSLPFLIPFIWIDRNNWHILDATGMGHMIFLSVFASTAGFYYYAMAMDLLGVTESSVFINFIPVVTVVFSYAYFGDMISHNQLIGGLIVIATVTASSIRDRSREKRQVAQQKIV